MLPTHIQIENFLSYREQEIDLSPIDLAVVSGKNGHGKSAIVEAMTWALWGEARKGTGSKKPDDDILNRSAEAEDGSTTMSVRVRFEVDGGTFAVRRSYRKSATGKTTTSDLEFVELSSSTGDVARDLTAGTQRETQAVVDEHVGMTYDLFTATSLFMQGRWDRILTATESERKDLFFELLRLDRFDDLKDAARERRRAAQSEADALGRTIDQLKSDLEGADKREDDLASAQEALAEAEEKHEELKSTQKVKQTKKQDLRSYKQNIAHARRKKETVEGEVKRLREGIEDATEEVEKLTEQVQSTDADRLRERAHKLEDLKEQRQKIRRGRKRKESLENKLAELEKAMSRATSQHKSKISVKTSRLDRIKGEINDLGDADKDDLQAFEDAKAEQDQDLEILSDNEEFIREDIADVRAEIASVQSKIDQEKSIMEEAGSGDFDRCPRCGTTMTDEHVNTITEEARSNVDALAERRSALESELEEYENELEDNLAEQEARGERDIAREIDVVTEQLQERERLQEQARELEQELERLDAEGPVLEDGTAMSEAQEKTDDLRQQIDGLDVSADALDAIDDKAEAAKDAERELSRHRERADKLASAKASREEDRAELAEKEEELETTRASVKKLQSDADTVKNELAEISVTEEDVDDAEAERDTIKETVARLKVQVETDQENAQKLENAQEERQEALETEETADHLSDAFGRHGIPSMILEGALPEIEDRANSFLDTLTGGQFQIRMDTTREKKTGGTTDTLSLTVIAGGLERPYSSLSGGESFRVAFALRVALSQHLAAKTGRPVRTLIIDEGFGTQDEEALGKVKDTIAAAAQQFERVLVITHIRSLKDAFPQRIEAERQPGKGSSLTVFS